MKALLRVLTLALVVAGTAFPAFAAPELSLDSAEVLQGQTAVLNLSISGGTEAYSGVNAKIRLPQGVTVSNISKGAVLSSGFTADWYASGSDVAVIAYSTSSTFSSVGALFTLNLQASYSTPPGDNSITFVSDTSSLSNSNALSNSDGSKSILPRGCLKISDSPVGTTGNSPAIPLPGPEKTACYRSPCHAPRQ
jgi:hypothetical protein